jgi:crossover junction endodeoxyribonuclease RuvC
MRILGVDPGTQRTGWGVVERRGSRLVGIEAGVVRAKSDQPLEVRLGRIYAGLRDVVERLSPDVVAVESIFQAKYASAAIKLGHVRGVALLVAAHAALPVHDYAPALVKRTVAGRGAADKRQLAALVCTILGWTEVPAADAADALAVAITHAQAARYAEAVGAAAVPRRRR